VGILGKKSSRLYALASWNCTEVGGGTIMIKRIVSILIVLSCGLVFHESGLSQSHSDYALIRKPLFINPDVYKLTKSFTEQEWGIQLFMNSPCAAGGYVITPTYEQWTSTTFHIDHGWNRLTYQEYMDNWIRTYGLRGSGTNQLLWPRAVDAHALCNSQGYTHFYFIFVMDTGNDRIVKFRYDWQYQNMDWLGTMGGEDLKLPTDLDLNNAGTFLANSDDFLWVLDCHQIKRFTMDGVLRNTCGGYGCSGEEAQFCRPSAVVCGRSGFSTEVYDRYANTRDIYVADPGNQKIVRLTRPDETMVWLKDIAAGPSIVDLEADNFGHIWAVDRNNGRIIKYTDDLFPLCTFGSEGAGENEFWRPSGISNAGGYLGLGDTFVSESWTDSSGFQHFCIGTDIMDLDISSSQNEHWHYIQYVLIDPSFLSIKIYNAQEALIKTIFEGAEFSGCCNHVWDGSDQSGQQVETGDYSVMIYDTSSYWGMESGLPTNTVTKQAWVHHVYNPYPNYLPGDANYDGNVNVGDVVYLVAYVFEGGPAPQPELCIGDVNGDGLVNIGDAVYLTNYIFKGGPGPMNGCQL
jgi:hypothetical protein